ncbi:MAG: sugar transferase [Planctomycetota bacterium]|jgi:lipopolysaccharide/colanic/teichoic acid biosynthesis glycosyltransferase
MLYRIFGKRLLDLVLANLALIVLTPALVLVAVLVRLKMGSPVFFRQQRPGLYGQPFNILKFRTMVNAYDSKGRPISDGARLTSLGRILRKTSLDELPELLNVLKGEMSFVGPRPLLVKYLNRYTPEQMRRHDIKPGLTGWAQINGRNTIDWDARFKLDVWYVDHMSLSLDLKIIFITFLKIFKREGICYPGHATMLEFKGNMPIGLHSKLWTVTQVSHNAVKQEENHAPSNPHPFSPEFKAQLILDLISGVKSVAEMRREFKLDPVLLARWQADFLENAAKAFQINEKQSF